MIARTYRSKEAAIPFRVSAAAPTGAPGRGRLTATLGVALVASSLTLGACAARPPASASDPSSAASSSSPSTPSPDVTTSAPVAADVDFAGQVFDRPTTIDNAWYTMRPGARYVYEGEANDGADRLARRIVFIVTDLTKVIGGVRSVVISENDFNDGELSEAELLFLAQDNDGNVWLMGEYPEEYEEGKLVGAPTWIHGLAGSNAGIIMQENPQLGGPDYSQGFAPAPVNWADRARVHKTGESICVPAGCYENVLVTEEFEPSVPDASQLKYYAPGVGTVQVGWLGSGEEEQEVLELVEATTLSPAELAVVRAEALALEQSAYQVSKDVYALTSPSE